MQSLQMASDCFLFTKYVKNVTLVQSHKKCIYSCSQSLWSMGSLHCRLLVIMVAMLTRGDGLVELKVTMLNIALDGGKCSYITLVNECLYHPSGVLGRSSTSIRPGMPRCVKLALGNGARLWDDQPTHLGEKVL